MSMRTAGVAWLMLQLGTGCKGDTTDAEKLRAENAQLKLSLAECQASAKAAATPPISPTQAPAPVPPAGEPLSVAELIDHTEKYKGDEITLPLSVNLDDVSAKLRDAVGHSAKFLSTDPRLDIVIALPKGIDVPNAKYMDDVMVTFDCTEGSLTKGNIAKKIVRK